MRTTIELLKECNRLLKDYGPKQLGLVYAGISQAIVELESIRTVAYNNDYAQQQYNIYENRTDQEVMQCAMSTDNILLRRMLTALLRERKAYACIYQLCYNLD